MARPTRTCNRTHPRCRKHLPNVSAQKADLPVSAFSRPRPGGPLRLVMAACSRVPASYAGPSPDPTNALRKRKMRRASGCPHKFGSPNPLGELAWQRRTRGAPREWPVWGIASVSLGVKETKAPQPRPGGSEDEASANLDGRAEAAHPSDWGGKCAPSDRASGGGNRPNARSGRALGTTGWRGRWPGRRRRAGHSRPR